MQGLQLGSAPHKWAGKSRVRVSNTGRDDQALSISEDSSGTADCQELELIQTVQKRSQSSPILDAGDG